MNTWRICPAIWSGFLAGIMGVGLGGVGCEDGASSLEGILPGAGTNNNRFGHCGSGNCEDPRPTPFPSEDYGRNFHLEDGDPFHFGEEFLSSGTNELANNLQLDDLCRPAPTSPCAQEGETPRDPFFDPVDYRGGVPPTGDNWMQGWTRLEENTVPGMGTSILPAEFINNYCAGNICTLVVADVSGLRLLEDMTWGPDYTFILQGNPGPTSVFVGDNTDEEATTLTILPGTTVYATGRIALVITRHSKIIAEGTRSSPITFTSAEPEPRSGDWGGIIINGRARVNCGAECVGEGESGNYGGTDDQDDSGVLKYVRIHYPGHRITGNQYNGLTLQGVGSRTLIDGIEVFAAAEDAIEALGGTVDLKHVLIHGARDDSLDWTFGWRGRVQHLVIKQEATNDRGFEGDNNSDNNRITPVSEPVVSNFTIVGAPGTGDAMTLRRGTRGQFLNGCVTTPEAYCLDVDNEATFSNIADGRLVFENVTLACP